MKLLHPEYCEPVREILSAAPNRWHTEDQIFRTFRSPSYFPDGEAEHLRQAIAWNVSNGFVETDSIPELGKPTYRLTAKGKQDQGVA